MTSPLVDPKDHVLAVPLLASQGSAPPRPAAWVAVPLEAEYLKELLDWIDRLGSGIDGKDSYISLSSLVLNDSRAVALPDLSEIGRDTDAIDDIPTEAIDDMYAFEAYCEAITSEGRNWSGDGKEVFVERALLELLGVSDPETHSPAIQPRLEAWNAGLSWCVEKEDAWGEGHVDSSERLNRAGILRLLALTLPEREALEFRDVHAKGPDKDLLAFFSEKRRILGVEGYRQMERPTPVMDEIERLLSSEDPEVRAFAISELPQTNRKRTSRRRGR